MCYSVEGKPSVFSVIDLLFNNTFFVIYARGVECVPA